MSDLFLHLVNISITAGWMILAVFLLRLLLKKAPKWTVCLLWALVGLRLLLPFTVESRVSLIPSAQTIPESSILSPAPVIETGITPIDQALNPLLSDALAPNPGDSVNPLQIYLALGTALWLAGIAGMLLYSLVACLKLRKRILPRIKLLDSVYLCDFIDSPFIWGAIRPIICVPSGLSDRHIKSIIAHEKAHLKRLDHVWKVVAYLLLTVYWFHPLIWVAYILLCRDIESACDEKVISDLSKTERADYSDALLYCSTNRRNYLTCPLAFGEVGVKDRINVVLNYKKPAIWILSAALSVIAVAAVCLLTDPPNQTKALNAIRRATYARELLITEGKIGYFENYLPDGMLGCCIGEDNKLYFRLEQDTEQLENTLREILGEYSDIAVFERTDLTKQTMTTYAQSVSDALTEAGFEIMNVRVAERSGNILVQVSDDKDLRSIKKAVKSIEKFSYGIDVYLYQPVSRVVYTEPDSNYMNSVRASERLMMYFYRNSSNDDYPDYYAGSYISEDNLYHIRLNRRIKGGEEKIRSILGGYADDVIFEYTNYSYNEVRKYYEDLSRQLRELGIMLTSGGPSEVTGAIEISALKEDIPLIERLLSRDYSYPFGKPKFQVEIREGQFIILE